MDTIKSEKFRRDLLGMTKERWLSDLRRFVADSHVKIDEPLHLHTLTRMGGPADIFVSPTNEDETAYTVKRVAVGVTHASLQLVARGPS